MSSIRKLSPKLQKFAMEQINERGETETNMALTRIKQWILTQPHLKVRMDDQWLIAFIRGSKFALERTQEKLNNFYTIRTIIPEFYTDKDPTKSPLRELISKGVFIPIRNSNVGPTILFYRSEFDPREYDINVVLKLTFIILDVLMYDDDTINIAGITAVCDLQNTSFRHMVQFSPMIARKCLYSYIHAYPLRFDGVHFINAPIGFQTVFDVIKFILPAKVKNRFQVHESLQELYERVPKENLPNEYGGEAGTITELIERCRTTIEKYKSWLIEDDQYGTDESLRPDGPVTTVSQFGNCSVM